VLCSVVLAPRRGGGQLKKAINQAFKQIDLEIANDWQADRSSVKLPIGSTTKKAFSGKLGGWVAFVTLDPRQSSWIGEDRSGVSISLVRFTSKSPDVRNSFTWYYSQIYGWHKRNKKTANRVAAQPALVGF